MNDVVGLTQMLVGIPSWVGDGCDETAAADAAAALLATVPWLTVERQVVHGSRRNVVARSPGDRCRLLVAGHLDTVEPRVGGRRDQFSGVVDGQRLYGLGALDMKGGIAAILSAVLASEAPLEGLAILLYCDEEYDFAGMRTFVAEYRGPRPQLCVVAEPTDLGIWNAHRGIIDIDVSLRGRSAHAADVRAGCNAIDGLFDVLAVARRQVESHGDPALGKSSMNVASFRGGLFQGTREGEALLGRQGNNVADYAEAVIDIRTASPALRAATVAGWIREEAQCRGLTDIALRVRHDLGALVTPPTDLRDVEQALEDAGVPIAYVDPATRGYGDGQMLADAWKVPVVNVGPAGEGMHAVDEYVTVDSLKALSSVYAALLRRLCGR